MLYVFDPPGGFSSVTFARGNDIKTKFWLTKLQLSLKVTHFNSIPFTAPQFQAKFGTDQIQLTQYTLNV